MVNVPILRFYVIFSRALSKFSNDKRFEYCLFSCSVYWYTLESGLKLTMVRDFCIVYKTFTSFPSSLSTERWLVTLVQWEAHCDRFQQNICGSQHYLQLPCTKLSMARKKCFVGKCLPLASYEFARQLSEHLLIHIVY